MIKTNVTVKQIEDSLCDLDTEYREALAYALMELKYVSDSPLRLLYGSEKQQLELKNVYEKPLKSKQIKEIINFISKKMRGDFQYGRYARIASTYLNIAEQMEKKTFKQR